MMLGAPEVATAYFFRSASLLARIAEILEKPEDAKRFAEIAENAKKAYRHACVKNGEIRSAILFDTDMNQIASFGKEIAFPEKQNYLRYEEDLNADYYYDDSEDFFYAFYYPIYNTLNGQGELAGMCVFILDRWTLDGTIRSLIGMNSAAILISDSNHLNLSWYTGGTLSDTEAMEVLRTDTDVIYKEWDW
jgi:two-component system sensor histidine kinase YesM